MHVRQVKVHDVVDLALVVVAELVAVALPYKDALQDDKQWAVLTLTAGRTALSGKSTVDIIQHALAQNADSCLVENSEL